MGIWLRFLRAPNLLMVALTQYILRHAVLRPALAAASTPIAFDLTEAQFALLVGATVCVTAGGYVVNDIYDQAIDAVNKPQRQVVGRLISERQAWGLYATILGLGLALAVLVALQADYLEWLWLYPASVGALWAYSARLKRTVLWGNVVVSLFSAGVVLLVWLAEQRAFATLAEPFPQAAQRVGVTFVFYAAFAFAGNLLREIVKDLEDVEGDGRHGARTLPVVRGVTWGKRAAFVLLAGLATLVIAFLVRAGEWVGAAGIGWGVAFILAPLAVVLVLLIRADGARDYRRVSTAVKGLMLAGLLYLPFVSAAAYTALMAALVAHGTNLGIYTMGQSTEDATVAQLQQVSRTRLREETLRRANAEIVNYHRRLPASRYWGEGEAASSDGQRFSVRESTLLSSSYPRYFGYYDRAVSVYTHPSDQYSIFKTQVISCAEREALFSSIKPDLIAEQ